jgi:AcrR family transcriptional regulator
MKKTKVPKRRRFAPSERQEIIVKEAIRYFAEVGMTGQTRELARRIGVTQGLLFRYFPTKNDLIKRVYHDVYLDRWNPRWETELKDRSVPFADRLQRFYKEYSRTIAEHDWMRIFLFSGLAQTGISRKYTFLFRDRIIYPLCHEIRHELALPAVKDSEITVEELQVCWALNGSVSLLVQREFVSGLATLGHYDTIIPALVDTFLHGVFHTMRKLNAPAEGAPPSKRSAGKSVAAKPAKTKVPAKQGA